MNRMGTPSLAASVNGVDLNEHGIRQLIVGFVSHNYLDLCVDIGFRTSLYLAAWMSRLSVPLHRTSIYPRIMRQCEQS